MKTCASWSMKSISRWNKPGVFFSEPNLKAVDKIKSRDKYIDTLKSLIQEKTYEILISSPYLEKNQINMIRSMNIISMNLERIADFSVNMIRQSGHLNDISFFQNFDYEGFFKEILEGLSRIEPAINQREKGLAFRICQCEFNLDELYGDNFKRILIELKSSRETGNLVTVLMMLHYLERMGDSLLNIGEAIIYALIGENLKIQQFKGLSDSLDASGLETHHFRCGIRIHLGNAVRLSYRPGRGKERGKQRPPGPVQTWGIQET